MRNCCGIFKAVKSCLMGCDTKSDNCFWLTVGLKAMHWGCLLCSCQALLSWLTSPQVTLQSQRMRKNQPGFHLSTRGVQRMTSLLLQQKIFYVSCSSPVHTVAADHSVEQIMHMRMWTRPLGRPLSQTCWTGPEKKVRMQSVKAGNERCISSNCRWFLTSIELSEMPQEPECAHHQSSQLPETAVTSARAHGNRLVDKLC